jgi:hypothetical protein
VLLVTKFVEFGVVAEEANRGQVAYILFLDG